MGNKDPRETAEKWGRNLKGASEDIKRGVSRVTEAPGIKAAAKVEKMKSRLIASIDDGTWENNVAAVPLSEWQNKMLTKGVPRISAGVEAANGKVIEFHTQLADHQRTIDAELERMDDITLEDSINRMTTQVRGMASFKFRR